MIYWLVYLQNSTSKCSLASTAPWKLSLVRTKTPSSTVMSSSAKATAVSTSKLKINIFILESGRIKWQLKMKWCLLPASTWQRAENSHACAFIRNSDAWSTAIGLPWPFDPWRCSFPVMKGKYSLFKKDKFMTRESNLYQPSVWLDKNRPIIIGLDLAKVLDYNIFYSQGLPNDKKVG